MEKNLSVYLGDSLIADKIECGNTFIKRFFGLMGRKSIAPDQGFYLEPCNSVHTFSMNFPIDVLFLAKDGTVLEIVQHMMPWRLKASKPNARITLELMAGTAGRFGISEGTRLTITSDK